LHLSLCEARPVSSPVAIPSLVNAGGAFYDPVVSIARFCLLAPKQAFRRELEAEVRAQFRAFAATGLRLDHVSGHNNLHLHPVVLPILVRVAREFGVRAIRVPYEPFVPSLRAFGTHVVRRFCVWAVMGTWTAWARRRLLAAGFGVNDQIFGVFECGAMTLERLRRVVAELPPGASEIHVHPATRRCAEIERTTPSYAHEAELQALLDPELRRAIATHEVRLVAGYRELLSGKEPLRAQSVQSTHADAFVAEGSSKS
jgi:hopanoid biosynthesis associated protein HpnK